MIVLRGTVPIITLIMLELVRRQNRKQSKHGTIGQVNRMDDTISRAAAIDALIELSVQRDEWDSKEGFSQKRGIDAAICAIEDLPSAERHGRWEDLQCTVCGKMGWSDEDDYCPNCGGKDG